MSNHAPELLDIGNGYCLRWPEHDVKVLIEYLKKQSNGLTAEVTVISRGATLCESVRFNLNTEPTTKAVAKKMAEADRSLKLNEWTKLLESTAVLVLRHHRRGEPAVPLTTGINVQPRAYTLNPLVYVRLASILFGPGGQGKSYLATLGCMMVQAGRGVAGFGAVPGRAAYIDWESDAEDLADRAERIRRGHPELKTAVPQYLRCYAPL